MSASTIYELDRELLSFFNGSNSLFMDGLSASLTQGYMWIPLYIALLLLVIKNNETMGQILLTIGCVAFCVLLSEGCADFLAKPLVGRLRPSVDPLVKYSVDIVDGYRSDGFSFFSAHSSNTMSVAIFFVLLVRDRVFTCFMLFWSLTNCWTRLYLGVHYPSDVFVGIMCGIICGICGYVLYIKAYKRIGTSQHFISSQYSKTGYSFPDIDVVICILLLIYIVSIILSLI